MKILDSKSYLNVSLLLLYNRFNEALRVSLFVIFFLLSIRFLFSYLIAAPAWMIAGGCCGFLVISLLCWWRLLFCLYSFIIAIPIVSGIQSVGIMDGIPLFSFSFSCIYIAWFLKRFFYQKKIMHTDSRIDGMVDLFAGLIIVSLIMQLSQYPLEFVLYRLKFASFLRQNDPFWCFEASFILLQGLFLYRLLSVEDHTENRSNLIDKIFNCQTIIVILFSSVQFVLAFNTGSYDQIKLFWPFDDIHSYGSYIVFLFFYHISRVIFSNRDNKFSLFASIMLFACVIFSYSRISWLVFLILLFVILLLTLPVNWRRWLIFSLIISFLAANLLLGPVLLKSENNYLNRLGKLVSITNYDKDRSAIGRLVRWKLALRIVKDFPLTGSGPGTYFRLAPNYISVDKDKPLIKKLKKRWNANNNVHNYYLQLWAEIGSIGVIVFFSILVCVYKKGLNIISLQGKRNSQIYGLLLGLSAYLLTMITSHPLIISKQQFLFWFIIFAIVFINSENKNLSQKGKIGTIVFSLPFVLFVLLLPGYFLNAKTIEDIEGINYEYGFYGKEKIEKRNVRWTMKMSGSKEFAKTDIVGLRVYAMSDNVLEENLGLEIFINKTLIDRVYFTKSEFKMLYYYIPGLKNHEYLLRTKVSKTFNPYQLGLTRNLKQSRDQGVAMEKIRYLTKLPKKYKKIDYAIVEQ